MRRLTLGLFIWLLYGTFECAGQERVLTAGIQIKPIFPSRILGTGPVIISEKGISYSFRQQNGYSAGMLIRKGMSKSLSFESGINFTARNYRVSITEGNTILATRARIINYEIPISQLVFIRLSEKVFMNVSGGVSLNMFPSDVIKDEESFIFYAGRWNVFQPALIANIGFEYRSKRSGYFYLGSSLNRPFNPIYATALDYLKEKKIFGSVRSNFQGTYLTVDLRYFFHEEPQKNLLKKKTK